MTDLTTERLEIAIKRIENMILKDTLYKVYPKLSETWNKLFKENESR